MMSRGIISQVREIALILFSLAYLVLMFFHMWKAFSVQTGV